MARAALEELLNTRRNIPGLDAKFRSSLLAVGLQVAQLVGQHDGPHDPQRGAQVGGPVAVTEVRDELVQERTVIRLYGEAEGLCTHTVKCN